MMTIIATLTAWPPVACLAVYRASRAPPDVTAVLPVQGLLELGEELLAACRLRAHRLQEDAHETSLTLLHLRMS